MKFQFFNLILFTALLFQGCAKKKCQDNKLYLQAADAFMTIDFYDKDTNDYLIKENLSKFSKGDISLFDNNLNGLMIKFYLNTLPEKPNDVYYRASIFLLNSQDDLEPVEHNKRLFIDFKNDRDTIDYTYKIAKNDCGSTLEYLNLYYNGEGISSIKNDIQINIKIKK